MNAFYNKEGVGDTLLISLQDVTREQLGYENTATSSKFSITKQKKQRASTFSMRLLT